MNIQRSIAKLCEKQDLDLAEMQQAMHDIMTGNCTDAQIAGFLVALRMKGETVAEITAAAQVMRDLSSKVVVSGECLVDMVGTGGDATGTFNISTAASLVMAACGAQVAKHGNRSVSSKSGSADLLEIAGVKLDISPEVVGRCINEVDLGFMFAPLHHSAMKYAINARKELGLRTIFNLLGPLTNPAGVKRQLTGVFAQQWVKPLTEVLQNLGSEHVMVVHGADGMDEISISAPTFFAELKNGKITTGSLNPEQFGFKTADIKTIQVADATGSLALINKVLANENIPARDIVCLNAGVAVYIAGVAATMEEGVQLAQAALADGNAAAKLQELIDFTNEASTENR